MKLFLILALLPLTCSFAEKNAKFDILHEFNTSNPQVCQPEKLEKNKNLRKKKNPCTLLTTMPEKETNDQKDKDKPLELP